jgi:hypothetical protein
VPLPGGLVAVIVVSESTVIRALTLPKSTSVAPVKPLPVIVTLPPPAVPSPAMRGNGYAESMLQSRTYRRIFRGHAKTPHPYYQQFGYPSDAVRWAAGLLKTLPKL